MEEEEIKLDGLSLNSEPDEIPEKSTRKPIGTIPFKFPHKIYNIPRSEKMDKVLAEIVENKDFLEEIIAEKCFIKDSTVTSITKYNVITAFEFYIKHHDPKQPNVEKDEKCCICLCNYFDDLHKMTYEQLFEHFLDESEDTIVELAKCDGHYFHLNCLKNYISSQKASYMKCPVCCYIYGIMTGMLFRNKVIIL